MHVETQTRALIHTDRHRSARRDKGFSKICLMQIAPDGSLIYCSKLSSFTHVKLPHVSNFCFDSLFMANSEYLDTLWFPTY